MARSNSSTRICTGEFISSDPSGLRMAPEWHPRLVAELTATATKDGPVERTSDPVDTITADLRWTNPTDSYQRVSLVVYRPARSVVTSNPNMVSIVDAVSSAIGPNPAATVPSVSLGPGGGIRLKTTRTTAATPAFGRVFADILGGTTEHMYLVQPGNTIHVRYRCAVVTPGDWRPPANGVMEAYARYANLKLYAAPYLLGGN